MEENHKQSRDSSNNSIRSDGERLSNPKTNTDQLDQKRTTSMATTTFKHSFETRSNSRNTQTRSCNLPNIHEREREKRRSNELQSDTRSSISEFSSFRAREKIQTGNFKINTATNNSWMLPHQSGFELSLFPHTFTPKVSTPIWISSIRENISLQSSSFWVLTEPTQVYQSDKSYGEVSSTTRTGSIFLPRRLNSYFLRVGGCYKRNNSTNTHNNYLRMDNKSRESGINFQEHYCTWMEFRCSQRHFYIKQKNATLTSMDTQDQ